MKQTPFPRNFPYKCFVCGKGHRHRGQNKYKELCKSCATRFMLKGKYQKFRLPCFGSLSCCGSLNRNDDYLCPLQQHCAKAAFEDRTLPMEAFRIFTEKTVNSIEAWRKKAK